MQLESKLEENSEYLFLNFLEHDHVPVTVTAFDDLKKRVNSLESVRLSWLQQHDVFAWVTGILIPVVVILLTILFGVVPHLENDAQSRIKNQVSDSLKEPLQNLGEMSKDIAQIKGTLEAWKPIMGPLLLKQSSSLPQNQFSKSLPQIRNAMQFVSETKVVLPPGDTLTQLASKLRKTDESSTDYWPTVLQFIRFASSGLSLDVPPPGKPNFELHGSTIVGRNAFGIIQHRVVLLDGGHS